MFFEAVFEGFEWRGGREGRYESRHTKTPPRCTYIRDVYDMGKKNYVDIHAIYIYTTCL